MHNPTTEAELAEAIAATKGPLAICGGGTRPIGRPVKGDTLSTAGLSGITLYEPGALTLVAKAGTPMAEIEAALDAENQMLAFEPMDHRTLLGTTGTPTIGGVVATNASGPRRVAASGACRDALLGVRYVDGQGAIVKNGGRVMKNVTGYDLTKLMAGSYGTLGVLSEVSLKVLPKPETSQTLVFDELALGDAVAAMTKALNSPYEVSGAALHQLDTGNTALAHLGQKTCLRVEGFEKSVTYRIEKLRTLLADFGDAQVLDHDASTALWADIKSVSVFRAHDAVTQISITPSAAADIADCLWQTLGADLVMDWGGGRMWFGMNASHAEAAADQFGANDPYTADKAYGLIHGVLQHMLSPEIMAHGAPAGSGHATLIKAPTATRTNVSVFQPQSDAVSTLTKALRAKFDPRGILNPGLMN